MRRMALCATLAFLTLRPASHMTEPGTFGFLDSDLRRWAARLGVSRPIAKLIAMRGVFPSKPCAGSKSWMCLPGPLPRATCSHIGDCRTRY